MLKNHCYKFQIVSIIFKVKKCVVKKNTAPIIVAKGLFNSLPPSIIFWIFIFKKNYNYDGKFITKSFINFRGQYYKRNLFIKIDLLQLPLLLDCY